MKKFFKGFATTLFIGTSLFSGINAVEQINHNSFDKAKEQIKDVTNHNQHVYNLAPGQVFDPDSNEFDDYWSKLARKENGYFEYVGDNAWLIAVENVTMTKNNYRIDFDYSVYANSFVGYVFTPILNVHNQSLTYSQDFNLDKITNYYVGHDIKGGSINVPRSSVDDSQNLVFDIEFKIEGYSHFSFGNYSLDQIPQFDLLGYDYWNDFFVDDFSFINNSITDEGFEFLIDVRINGENPFIPYGNNLTLFSSGMPLNTEFEGYQGNFLKYKVSGLQSNSIYTNFSVGIVGYSDIESLDDLAISTITNKDNSNVGLIIGSTIGGIFVLLLILLIILLLLKRRKKVVEYNYYHNYRTFVDQQGNYIEMNQAEYDALDKNVAAQYEEVDTTELLDGHYEYQPE